MNRSYIRGCVLDVVREISEDSTVSFDTEIENIQIDSIGWMRCLAAIEEKLGCAVDPAVFFSEVNDSIDNLCSSLLQYFKITE